VHIYLFVLWRLVSKAHTTIPPLDNADSAKDESNSPCQPRKCTDSCTCAGYVTYLSISRQRTVHAFGCTGKKRKKMCIRMSKLTMPKHILPLKNTANATNPLNQNNIVKPSSPSSAHFTLALSLKLSNFGTSWRRSKGTRERRDHEGAKMR
jgi:hypothetical protein